MKDLELGSKLYWVDTKDLFGEVVKILKYTVWVEEPNGNIKKRWPIDFAKNMLNK